MDIDAAVTDAKRSIAILCYRKHCDSVVPIYNGGIVKLRKENGGIVKLRIENGGIVKLRKENGKRKGLR